MGKTSAQIWWKYVPSSRKQVKSTMEKLLSDGMSVLLNANIQPWFDQFKADLLECIDKYGEGIEVRHVNGSDLGGGFTLLDDVVSYLDIESGYNGKLASVKDKLPEQGLILWMSNLSDEQENGCRKLAEEAYKLRGAAHAHALMLIFESRMTKKTKNLHIVETGPLVKEDINYFAYRVLMENEYKGPMDYAVALAMELSGGDIEQCAKYCEDIVSLGLQNPLMIAGDESADSKYAVHRAQMRSLEPLIQLCRIQIIKDKESAIKKILPFEDDYKYVLKEPCELELRHLWHYQTNLSFSREEFLKLKLLYDARNDLSHQHLLEYDTIQELIKLNR